MEYSQLLKDFFSKRNVEITLFPERKVKRFKELNGFIDFLQNEINYWSGINQDIDTFYRQIGDYIREINRYANNEQQMQNLLQNIIQQASRNNYPCLFSDTYLGKMFKDMDRNEKVGFIDLYFKDSINAGFIQQPGYFSGLLKAYSHKNALQIINHHLKEDFEKNNQECLNILEATKHNANDIQTKIIDDAQKINEEFVSSNSKIQEDFSNWENSKRMIMIIG
jgi:hypothetical protein